MDWFAKNAAAIQAIAAIVTVVVTLGLAAITYWYVRVTREIANSSAEQVRQMREAVASQRAHIAARPHDHPAKDILSATPRVQLEVVNCGQTPAYDTYHESWIEILPFPFEDFSSSAAYFRSDNRMTLAPGGSPMILNIPVRRTITPEEITAIKRLELYVCFRVKVSYKDAMGQDRFSNFGFYVGANELSFLPRYNDSN